MSESFDLAKLAKALSTLRRRSAAKTLSPSKGKKRIRLNQLAKLTGISRRTLARLEKTKLEARKSKLGKGGHAGPSTVLGMTTKKGRTPGISARTAFKLAKLLLGEEETERRMEEQTRLSRFLGPDPLYKFLDDLYHYPSFLFHDSVGNRALREEFGDDYRHSLDLLLRSGFGTRNLEIGRAHV